MKRPHILGMLLVTLGLAAGMAQAQATVTATVTWTNVPGESGYRLDMQTGGTGPFFTMATTGVDVVTTSVPGLTLSTQYCFQVTSLGTGGLNAAPSTAVCSTPLAPPPSAIVGITWTQP